MADREFTKVKVKRGDMVRIIAGKDKGRNGKVLIVDRAKNRVIVEGINMIHRHTKPGRTMTRQQGGIITREAPIDASNVMYLHKGEPTRIGFKVEQKEVNGKTVNVKYRVAKSTGEVID